MWPSASVARPGGFTWEMKIECLTASPLITYFMSRQRNHDYDRTGCHELPANSLVEGDESQTLKRSTNTLIVRPDLLVNGRLLPAGHLGYRQSLEDLRIYLTAK